MDVVEKTEESGSSTSMAAVFSPNLTSHFLAVYFQNPVSTFKSIKMITTQVEINVSPETVRKALLNFPIVSKWHKGLVKSITPLDPVDPLAVGKKLHCEMEDFEFDSIFTENSPNKFAWQGPPVMTVSGLHSFLIEPSKSNPSGTKFTQLKVYSGGVSFLMQPWLMGKPIKGQFEKYNAYLKKKCESF